MARLAGILKALGEASWRAQRSAGSVASNNFFLMSLLLLQRSGAFLYVLVGLFLLFPLSADPLHRIPPERLALWPLARSERRWLRVLSPWVSPGSWIIVAVAAAAWRSLIGFDLMLLLAGVCAAGFALSFAPRPERGGALRFVPSFPGRWGQLVRKDLRGMLAVLDVYVALLLTVGGVAYPEAREGIVLLVVLALSTPAQCLFGLDGPGGLVRYRLLPMSGWTILLAKDVAFITLAILFTAPLSFVGGLAGILAALAVGHAPSVEDARPQARWRFASSAGLGISLVQTVALAGATVCAARYGPLVLLAAALSWMVSLLWYGHVLDRLDG